MTAIAVCAADQLDQNLGVAALLPGDAQAAVFRVGEALYAVDNVDPYTGAAVMSRGIVGEVGGRPTVASPLLKQRFYLDDGSSLQGDGKALATYAAREEDGTVLLEA